MYCWEILQYDSINCTVRYHVEMFVLFDFSTIYYIKSVSIKRTVLKKILMTLLNVPYKLKIKTIIG